MLGPDSNAKKRLQIAPEAVAFGLLCLFGVSLYVVREAEFTMPSVRAAIIEGVKVMLIIAAASWVAFLIGGKSERAGNGAFIALFLGWTLFTGGGLALDAATDRVRMAEAGDAETDFERDEPGTPALSDEMASVLEQWAEYTNTQDEAYAERLAASGLPEFRQMDSVERMREVRSSIDPLSEIAAKQARERKNASGVLEGEVRRVSDESGASETQLEVALEAIQAEIRRSESMAGFYALEIEALGELRQMLEVLESSMGLWRIGEDGLVEFNDRSSVLVAQRYIDARTRLAALGQAQATLRVHAPPTLAQGEDETPSNDRGVAHAVAPTP